jgi:hypothetical protein
MIPTSGGHVPSTQRCDDNETSERILGSSSINEHVGQAQACGGLVHDDAEENVCSTKEWAPTVQ